MNADIIVFSHLRWEFVTQRPQHILGRFSKHSRILFVEEPIPFTSENQGTANVIRINNHLTVLQPRMCWTAMPQMLSAMINMYVEQQEFSSPVLWFYSPAFIEMAEYIDHSLTVYDCMDELSAFQGAPASLIEQERKLLSQADVVFTGGTSLYQAKKELHPNVYCFPSSVDAQHFQRAHSALTKVPADMQRIRGPRVGFYGVIDERIDVSLLDQLAKLAPEISFVLIGPVVKIHPDKLPQHPNVYYLGERKYATLPAYLKGMQATMMPFALNAATRFISPTKTLEFMAAKKPIISTPIHDVVKNYPREVRIARTPEDFVAAVYDALHETVSQKRQREIQQMKVIQQTSWDTTVKKMQGILTQLLMNKQTVEETSSWQELQPSFAWQTMKGYHV